MTETTRPFFPRVARAFANVAMIVFGRDLQKEWKGRGALFVLLSILFVTVAFWKQISDLPALFTGRVPVSQTIIEKMEARLHQDFEDLRVSMDVSKGAATTQISATETGGLVATFAFPQPGRITKWELYFAFTTDCENDHFAKLTSPTGRSLIVMNRGLGRCPGELTNYSGRNDQDNGAFIGSEALGNWTFSMSDLDRNAHTGTLNAVWMKLTVEDQGKIVERTVQLSGLPMAIPQPSD